MFNVGGGELLVILLVALIVLGPTRLPTVAKQAGNLLTQIRAMSGQFSRELQEAIPDEVVELRDELDKTRQSLRAMSVDDEIERKAREKGRRLVEEEQAEKTRKGSDPFAGKVSTAASAGMFDLRESEGSEDSEGSGESVAEGDELAPSEPDASTEATDADQGEGAEDVADAEATDEVAE